MKRIAYMVVLLLVIVAFPVAKSSQSSPAVHCGLWRWDVKTLTDPAASRVNFLPIAATVEQLGVLPVPGALGPTAPRFDQERQTYRVTTRLVKAKQEADSDFHLVIAGTSGNTMIAEIPSPDCANGNSQIGKARADYIRNFGQPSRTRFTDVPGHPRVTVTGVLFFDEVHGQAGVAPNGVELHPVLAIKLTAGASAKARLTVNVVELSSPVDRRAEARLGVETSPGAECTIEVRYASGPSKAQGLVPMEADSKGRIVWTWKVGTNTTPGTWPIFIECSLDQQPVELQTQFTVR